MMTVFQWLTDLILYNAVITLYYYIKQRANGDICSYFIMGIVAY